MAEKNPKSFHQRCEAIYHSPIYILAIVVIAVISLFNEFSVAVSWGIYCVFWFDLLFGSLLWLTDHERTKRGRAAYLKYFAWDILAAIPLVNLGIFKLFRLVRLVRLMKLRKLNDSRLSGFNVRTFFSVGTLKSFAIYLCIYFVGNIYIYSQLEHKSIIDSVYWLFETVSTVGYGNIAPTQTATKILAIVLMVVGVATVGYLNGILVTTIVSSLQKQTEQEIVKEESEIEALASGPSSGRVEVSGGATS